MFGVPLRVFIGAREAVDDYTAKRYKISEKTVAACAGKSMLITFPDGKAEGFIWLPSIDIEKPSDLSVLSHECNHITIDVLDRVGIPLTPDNQETLCYLQEYYFRESLKMIKQASEQTRILAKEPSA